MSHTKVFQRTLLLWVGMDIKLFSRGEFSDSQCQPFNMTDFNDAKFFEVSSSKGEQLTSTYIMGSERFRILVQLQRLQPAGHFSYTPRRYVSFSELVARWNTTTTSKALPKSSTTFTTWYILAILWSYENLSFVSTTLWDKHLSYQFIGRKNSEVNERILGGSTERTFFQLNFHL